MAGRRHCFACDIVIKPGGYACPECVRRGEGTGALVHSLKGPVCVVCGWGRDRLGRGGRRRRQAGMRARVHRRAWEPITAVQAAPGPLDADGGTLTLSAPPPDPERDRTAKVKDRILEALRERGPMTRDGLCELLGERRRVIVPRSGELMAEGKIRESGWGVTRAGRPAHLLVLVEET